MKTKKIITAIATGCIFFGSINFSYAESDLNSVQSYFKNAVKLSISGQIDKALLMYLEIIRIDPMFTMAYNNLGCIYRQKGKIEKAIEYFNKVVELKPRDDTAHTNLAGCYDSRGDHDTAIEEYMKALEIDPGSITVELALEKVLQKKATREGRSFEEVKTEIDLKYPVKQSHNSYDSYADLLQETGNN